MRLFTCKAAGNDAVVVQVVLCVKPPSIAGAPIPAFGIVESVLAGGIPRSTLLSLPPGSDRERAGERDITVVVDLIERREDRAEGAGLVLLELDGEGLVLHTLAR